MLMIKSMAVGVPQQSDYLVHLPFNAREKTEKGEVIRLPLLVRIFSKQSICDLVCRVINYVVLNS